MQEIKAQYTIIIVTHNMQQAARVSDRTAFFTTEVNDESDTRTGLPRRVRRHRQDLLGAVRRADGELCHRTIRLNAGPAPAVLRRAGAAGLQVEMMGVLVDQNLERMREVLRHGDGDLACETIGADDRIDAMNHVADGALLRAAPA